MEKEDVLLLIIFSFFLLKPIAGSKDDCLPASCGPHEPEVRFPFRILSRQPDRCGYPGFDLSCDEQNKTILRLPSSTYIVNRISYVEQVLHIDPGFCRPNGIVGVNITDTPFSFSYVIYDRYTFYNCSLQSFDYIYRGVPFPCLSSKNYSVFASTGFMPSNCNVMKTIVVWNGDISEELKLLWFTPYCRSCEREGKPCGLKSDGQTICVSSSHGISKSAKYGLSLGIGVPALIFIIALVCRASSKVQGHNDTRNQTIDLPLVVTIPQPATITGLDGPTIESYPKTVLGDSYSLPSDDGTCAICLSDYKPKESLRTIPQCNHYFHVVCIDEWLKLNATCPVCRITLESLVLVTPCSTASSSNCVDSS